MAPGLYRSEKNAFLPFLISSPIMFFLGAAFAFYVVMPLAFDFFLGFQQIGGLPDADGRGHDGDVATPLAQAGITFQGSVDEYLSLTIKFILAFGLCFQLPVLLTLMGKAGLVSAQGLRGVRKYAVVGILVLAARGDAARRDHPGDPLHGGLRALRDLDLPGRAGRAEARSSSMRAEGLLGEDEELWGETEDEVEDGSRGERPLAADRRRARADRAAPGRGARTGTRPRPSSGTSRPTGWTRCARSTASRCRCCWGSTGRATRCWRTRATSPRGLPANNALLWGARGMGKSSLVKAVHAEVCATSIR